MSASDVISSLPSISVALAVVVACVVLPAVVFLIYKFSIKEKSFEEVLEEQKRRNVEEELKLKAEKSSKKEKKFKKGWSKKKEKGELEEKKDARETPEVEVIEVPSPEVTESKELKAVKVKNKKPPTTANGPSTVGKKTQPELPSQSAEIVPRVEKKEVQKVSESKSAKVTPPAKQAEVPKKDIVREKSPNVASVGAGKKKKKESSLEKDGGILITSNNQLLNVIKDSALDTDEVQNLIDILLNKQKDASSWTKPHDALADTKKSLQEKEQLLDQEQSKNQSMASKLKDVRDECNSLKGKLSSYEKASHDKISKQQQELQALSSKLKQAQEQLNSEKQKNEQLEKTGGEKAVVSMKKLEEEKAKLQQQIVKLESDLKSGMSKPEFEELKKSHDNLKKTHQVLVEQHTSLIPTHQAETKKLIAEHQAELKKLTVQQKQFEEIGTKNSSLEKMCKTLETKLKEEEKASTDLKSQLKELSSKSAPNLNEIQSRVRSLEVENERLREQIVSTKDRVAEAGQEILHQNGEVNGRVPDEATLKSIEEKEKLLKEKDNMLAQLNDEVKSLKGKVTKLEEENATSKKRNDELHQKNYKAMEAVKAAESATEKKVKEAEARFAEVKSQAAVPKGLEEKLSRSEAECAKRLSDYNVEVQKNKKLQNDLEKATSDGKVAQSRLTEMQSKAEVLSSQIKESHDRTKQCLQRLYPAVTIDSSLSYDTWLVKFAEESAKLNSSATDKAEVSRLQSALANREKELLQKEKQLKDVLADTDATLSNLQEKGKAAEKAWADRLSNNEAELKKVASERDALAAEKLTMQSTMQQIGQLEELREKLKLLQSTLEGTEHDKHEIEQKYDEVSKNCLNLRDQLENKEKQITELEKGRNSAERITKEMEELKSKLDQERKINKDFSSQMIKLNSLVKIGQASLAEEQEMVKKLKSELDACQKLNANGNTALSSQSAHIEDASGKK